MEKKRNKLVELVNLWDAFEQDNPQAEIADFCQFYLLSEKLKSGDRKLPIDTPPKPGMTIDGELAGVFSRLYRYSTLYAKKVLSNSALNNLEDFVYLIVLLELGTPKKNELIQQNLSEFTSGIGVINRLLKDGLITEFPDPDDARSKRIRMTPKGQQVLFSLLPKMDKVAKLVFFKLNDQEKDVMFRILRKLEIMHDSLYIKIKKQKFDEVITTFEENTESGS